MEANQGIFHEETLDQVTRIDINIALNPWIYKVKELHCPVSDVEKGKDYLMMMFLVNLYSTGAKNCGILNCEL